MHLHETLSVAPGVIYAYENEALFVLDTSIVDPRPVKVLGSGIHFWGLLCEQPGTFESLIAQLAAEVDVEVETVAQGLGPFVKSLLEQKLIEAK